MRSLKISPRGSRVWRFLKDPDHNLATLLFLLLLYMTVFVPLYGSPVEQKGLSAVAFSLILFTGVLATAQHHLIRYAVIAIAVMAFCIHWAHLVVGGFTLYLLDAITAILFFTTQGYYTLARVFGPGRINAYRILGSIAGYIMIGLIFSNIYLIIILFSPDAFRFDADIRVPNVPLPELHYYSFVTLTTIGYGDITPLNAFARAIVSIQGLIGQLYPAILIARLVTLYQHDAK